VTTVCVDSQHLWLRLSPFLDVEDVESEVMMWHVLCSTYKLVLLPGHMAGVAQPGWFRACVAGVDEDTLVAGFDRLESFIKAQKMLHGRW
jgi:aspartate/methionine/tyrosine aminotransferase